MNTATSAAYMSSALPRVPRATSRMPPRPPKKEAIHAIMKSQISFGEASAGSIATEPASAIHSIVRPLPTCSSSTEVASSIVPPVYLLVRLLGPVSLVQRAQMLELLADLRFQPAAGRLV